MTKQHQILIRELRSLGRAIDDCVDEVHTGFIRTATTGIPNNLLKLQRALTEITYQYAKNEATKQQNNEETTIPTTPV